MNDLEIRFIRHGFGTHMIDPTLVIGHAHDATLTEEGRLQATQKGNELRARGFSPDVIVSSPSVRCVETATFTKNAMGIDTQIELDDELIEQDQGEASNRPKLEMYTEEVLEQIKEQTFDFAFAGGESIRQVAARGMRWLDAQKTRDPSVKSILAFTHGGLITCTVAILEGWTHEEFLAKRFTIDPVSETRLILKDGAWHLDYFAQPLEQ